MSVIRHAFVEYALAIHKLLNQLGYPVDLPFFKKKLSQMLQELREDLFVLEDNSQIVAFISIHYIPQLAFSGDFARISYFCVDSAARGRGYGSELEAYCVSIAKARGCDRIELHSHSRRIEAHKFYCSRGYIESPKYFVKTLDVRLLTLESVTSQQQQ